MDQVLGGRMMDMSEDAAGDDADVPEDRPLPAMEEVAERLSGQTVIDPEQGAGSIDSLQAASTVPLNGEVRSSRTATS